MKEKTTQNKSRSKTFGVVINPKVEDEKGVTDARSN